MHRNVSSSKSTCSPKRHGISPHMCRSVEFESESSSKGKVLQSLALLRPLGHINKHAIIHIYTCHGLAVAGIHTREFGGSTDSTVTDRELPEQNVFV